MKEDALSQVNRENKLLYTKTALYSPLDIEYQQEYRGPFEDLSFYSDDAVVIAGLKDGMISGFGRPMVAFGDDKVLKEQIQRLYNISPHITYMDYLGGGTVSAVAKFLLQKGATAKPYFTQIIDLTKTEVELHADVRKSYKSLLNKGNVTRIGGHLATYKMRELHFQMHGYATRTPQTWQLQQKMIDEDQAYIYADMQGNDFVTACLVCYNDIWAYYASGASLPNTNSHHTIYSAICWAKCLGCHFFEIGEQVFSGIEKLINISKFKRGFGGRTYMRLMIDGL